MNPRHFVSLSAVFCLLGGFSAPSVQAAEVRASGKVLDLKGSPLNGVTVKMSGSDEVATTDNSGDWTLGVGTDVLPRKGIGGSFLTSGLFLEQGRIRVSFLGHDPQGRGVASFPPAARAMASRKAGSDAKDTLVFSKNGKVFLRDTLTAPRTGIVRVFDTTWNAAIIYGWPEDGRDTTVYRSVKVGSQIWLAQNLAYAGTDGKLGVCQGSEDSCARYGRLYKWTEMMDLGRAFDTTLWSGEVAAHRGICPAGWHVPSTEEWTSLQTAVDPDNSYDGNRLKSPFFWQGSSYGEDKHGFRALPGGRWNGGSLEGGAIMGYWWSRKETFRTSAELFEMYSHNENTMFESINKLAKQSVRCLMD
jgi:uncharacterized protein (TIGR02145 family)